VRIQAGRLPQESASPGAALMPGFAKTNAQKHAGN